MSRGTRGRFQARPEWDRFWEKVDHQPGPGGCWLWTGTVDRDGYGLFKVKRNGAWTWVRAHRWAYEALIGPIPPGYTLDHVRARGCIHRRCVNAPGHLEPVTATENARRARRQRAEGTHQ